MSISSVSPQTVAEGGSSSKARRSIADNAIGVPFESVPALIGLGRTKCAELVKDGTLESVKIGKSRIVKMRSIRALIEGEAA